MTLEEVIEYLEKMIEIDKIYEVSSGAEENRQLADWLKELKAYREQGGDAISRADAEALFRTARSKLNPSDYKTADEFNTRDLMLLNAEQIIHLLPSVTPQPKTGRWIIKDGKEQGYDIGGVKTWYIQIMCSECGFIKTVIEGHMGQYNYCPNCGTKMQEVEE